MAQQEQLSTKMRTSQIKGRSEATDRPMIKLRVKSVAKRRRVKRK